MTSERLKYLRAFANTMAQTGLSYPGCGGGPALRPLKSAAVLRTSYGEDVVKLCLELLLTYPDLDELDECTEWLAAGILLLLGDESVLATLMPVAQRLLAAKSQLEHFH